MKIFFLIALSLVVICHLIFTIRPLTLGKNFRPKTIDNIARNLAHILLPVIATWGIFILENPYLILLLWSPLILIIISLFIKRWLKERYYVLPISNSIILTLVLVLCL